jgi:Competence protein CoiA-like family
VTQLFAALAKDDSIKFVGDVARGAACDCRCPSCFSPLVAKQGDEKDWHFAHEGRQERPECLVGAINLLHRLAVEFLQGLATLEFPRYSQTARARSLSRSFSEDVAWGAQLIGRPTWLGAVAKGAPVARGRMDNGISLVIRVEISEAPPTSYPITAPSEAVVAFWCTVPVTSDLRKRLYVEQHLRRHGRFVWLHQPDVFGLVHAARKRLEARAAEDDEQFSRERRELAESAAQRWAETSRSVANGCDSRVSYPWAPDHDPRTSFILYRFAHGAAWVFYTMLDGEHAVAPWPSPQEDWDHALPVEVGLVDRERLIYRVEDRVSALIYLSRASATMLATSNPAEFGTPLLRR